MGFEIIACALVRDILCSAMIRVSLDVVDVL